LASDLRVAMLEDRARRAKRAGRALAALRSRAWLLLILIAAAVFALGYFAYRQLHYNVANSLYHSLQLFGLEAPDVPSPSWTLTLARFAAPAIAATALLQTGYALFRDELQGLGVRLLARDHVVISGLGGIGFGLAVGFHDAGLRVVIVERDAANPAIPGVRRRSIPVIVGDAADPGILTAARLDRARCFITACGDDAVNLDVLGAGTIAASQNSRLTELVHIGDRALWRWLQAESLAQSERFPFRVEFFNMLDAGARVLLAEHPPFSAAAANGGGPPHLLLVGLDPVGEFALLRAGRLWRTSGHTDRLAITLVGPDVRRLLGDLLARHPDLAEVCDVAAHDTEISDARFQRGELPLAPSAPRITAAYIFLEDQSAGMAAALAVRAAAPTRGIPIVVVSWQAAVGSGTVIGLADLPRFPVLSRVLNPGLLLMGANEVLARLRHEHYLRRETANGDGPVHNPSLVPWAELPPALKESNRAFADGVGRKLLASHCVLLPAPMAAYEDAPSLFDEDEVERLARLEHERWKHDLEQRGWRWSRGPKDPHRKRHPLLVPWEELDERDRERDRDAIRNLPAILVRAGFVIQRTDGVQTSAP
jgi:hypothetical protein